MWTFASMASKLMRMTAGAKTWPMPLPLAGTTDAMLLFVAPSSNLQFIVRQRVNVLATIACHLLLCCQHASKNERSACTVGGQRRTRVQRPNPVLGQSKSGDVTSMNEDPPPVRPRSARSITAAYRRPPTAATVASALECFFRVQCDGSVFFCNLRAKTLPHHVEQK